jgi:hypothetical protein
MKSEFHHAACAEKERMGQGVPRGKICAPPWRGAKATLCRAARHWCAAAGLGCASVGDDALTRGAFQTQREFPGAIASELEPHAAVADRAAPVDYRGSLTNC